MLERGLSTAIDFPFSLPTIPRLCYTLKRASSTGFPTALPLLRSQQYPTRITTHSVAY
jgi:hypothetical protein